MFAIYYSMVDFFIHGVDLLGGYDYSMLLRRVSITSKTSRLFLSESLSILLESFVSLCLYPKLITSSKMSSAEHSRVFIMAISLSRRGKLFPLSTSDK